MDTVTTTVAGDRLKGFVERLERLRADKKEIAADEKVVMAEAKADGFDTKIIRHCIKVREKKPSELQEAEALADIYLSALGMATEPPLFRAMGLATVDIAAKEQVVEALKKFVPAEGAITIEAAGGLPIRLVRDKDGNVRATEVQKFVPPDPAPTAEGSPRTKAEPPEVDSAGAYALGVQAGKEDMPVISNPFPFGDARRPRWDEGWRKGAGNDGMGPE